MKIKLIKLFPIFSIAFIWFLLYPAAPASAFTISLPQNYLALTSGLVGWWSFDGPKMTSNVADSSGQGNTGYLYHSGSGTSTVSGKIGQALNFDGANDYVEISGPAATLQITGDITISSWVRTSYNGDYQVVVDDLGGSPYTSWAQWIDSSGKIVWYSSGTWKQSAGSVNDGAWHQIVSRVSSNNLIFYIDGILDANSYSSMSAREATSDNKAIGKRADVGYAYRFKGSIDDVRIYNRALSASEIRQLYNLGAGGKTNIHKQFAYNRAITIDHTKVGTVNNTDQSNFPVLFSGTYAYLATTTSGKAKNINGYDIGFYSNPDCSTGKLSWETDSYSGATGAVNYWVKIPTVSYSTDTVFYLCYGNSSITADQSNKTGVWDDGLGASGYYKGVWHLSSAASITDSTSNGNNGTNSGATATSGTIGGALYLNKTSGWYLGIPFPAIGTTQNWSLEMWLYQTDAAATYETVIDTGGRPIGLWINGSSGTASWAEGLLTGSLLSGSFSIGLTPSVWHQLVFSRTSGVTSWFVDGTQKATLSNTASLSAQSVHFGDNPSTGGTNYLGNYDEIRVSTYGRSADWVKTSYNNQNSPSTFYTVGGEQAIGTAVISKSPANVLNSGLVGYWTFDGPKLISNVADSSGQGNTGYLSHSGSGTSTAPGKVGQALRFDGVDDYVQISTVPTFSGNILSESVWFYRKSNSHNYECIVSIGRTSASYGAFSICSMSDGKIRAHAESVYTTDIKSDNVVSNGQWHHAVMVSNGVNYYLYIDGVLQTSVGTTGSPGADFFRIGKSIMASEHFDGVIDDVRLYNRVLSASEIQKLYNMGR